MTEKPTLLLARRLAVVVGVFALTVGCNDSPYNANVSGSVTLDGAPVGPGVITFVPPTRGPNPGVGTIQPNGTYFLKTKHERGINSGDYKVAIQVYKPEPGLQPGERSYKEPEPAVPEKYLQSGTSGLSFEVKPGSQTIDIELTSE